MKISDVNYNDLSPMMKQYVDTKKNYMDELLFYRLGDFYELFFEDAEVASHVLGLTLTGKNAGLKERVPMCGVPHHSVKSYIKEALDKGYKIAICEQVEDPKQAKGMVKREVTEVISKGTMTDLEFLDGKDFNYIGSIISMPSSYLVTYADISTGELNTVKIDKDDNALINIILNNNFKEVIMEENADVKLVNTLKNIYNIDITLVSDVLEGEIKFLEELNDPIYEKGIRHLLYYLNVRELKDISHFDKVNILDNDEYLSMDIHTVRNLELVETIRAKERRNSLLWLIDKCKTSMGSRKLKSWLLKPLRDIAKINDRLDKIDKLNIDFILRSSLEQDLYEIYDIERLCGKVASGSANARDLIQLKNSLKVLPDIIKIINELKFDYKFKDFKELTSLIDESIDLDAPITLKDGGLIKSGYNDELDELRKIRKGGKDFISGIEESIKEETGISNLKIGYNKVFGYYIEVTKSNVDKIPEGLNWERKQTLVGAERYISPELKEKENMILNAEERLNNLEYEVFLEIKDTIKKYISELQIVSGKIAYLDVMQSFATIAEDNNFVKPVINDDHTVNIIGGRHPVVESVIEGEYIDNDICLDSKTNILIITGPNMSGKSTYMREFGIIAILNQIGSYVPAKSCEIPIFDKIFTRIGASDDLVGGESTFMVEMKESAYALKNATENSLILFDELGRGTSTYDGMALAGSIIEYISNNIKCKTLFSTHYHELTDMEHVLTDVKNVHVSIDEKEGDITFLHKVMDGAVDKSYGINVAKLADLPSAVIDKANELLDIFETKENKKNNHIKQFELDLSEDKPDELREFLKTIDPYRVTPIEAINILDEINKKAGR